VLVNRAGDEFLPVPVSLRSEQWSRWERRAHEFQYLLESPACSDDVFKAVVHTFILITDELSIRRLRTIPRSGLGCRARGNVSVIFRSTTLHFLTELHLPSHGRSSHYSQGLLFCFRGTHSRIGCGYSSADAVRSRLSRKPAATELKSIRLSALAELEPPRSQAAFINRATTWPSVLTAVNHAPMNPRTGLLPAIHSRYIEDNRGVRFLPSQSLKKRTPSTSTSVTCSRSSTAAAPSPPLPPSILKLLRRNSPLIRKLSFFPQNSFQFLASSRVLHSPDSARLRPF